jgi:hypothetical protein
MSEAVTLQEVEVKDISHELEGLSKLKFRREKAISGDSHLNVKRDVIYNEEGDKLLGFISQKRQTVRHEKIMDWVINSFNRVEVPYQMKTSQVYHDGGSYYSEFVFNEPINDPDGYALYPMALVNTSIIHKPLTIEFGIHRFICSNGCHIGNSVEKIGVNARQLNGLMSGTLEDDISGRLNQTRNVSEKYKSLMDNTDFADVTKDFLLDEKVPMGLKKRTMNYMEKDNMIHLTTPKFKAIDLAELKGAVFEQMKDSTAWYLYNSATNVATHEARTVNSRKALYQSISNFFEI